MRVINESNISIPGPSHRQIDVTPTTGFSKNDCQPRIPPFIGNPGMQFAAENEADVMSYFDHYIPPELIEIVVDQTNLYAQQQIVKMPRTVTKHALSEEWKPVTVIKMKKFLGLIFVTGIVRKPKLELCWSTRRIFQTPIFPQTMSKNGFQLIQRYLHFNDNNATGTSEDRLYKIRKILDIVVNNFRTNYIPDREISLDGKLKNHKLVHISPTKNDKTPTRKCRVCVRKNIKKETRFLCAQCGVPLHPEGCYTRYYKLKHS